MASQAQILAIIVSYLVLIQHTNSDTIQCPATSTECNCPTVGTPQPCTLLCNNVDVCQTMTLNCRAGDPCSINCHNAGSCTDATINANSATDVNLICDGYHACKDIKTICGTGDCTLHCNTNTQSCFDIDSVDATLAKSFQCTGFCPVDGTLPAPFYAPTATPTLSPTIPPSTHTISPTLYPTASPTSHPSIPPSHTPTEVPSYSPTKAPSQRPSTSPSQMSVLSAPTKDQIVTATSLADNAALSRHSMLLTDTCYIIIAISIIVITCICCVAFCLVYLNHKHTQKMLVAATTSYFANVSSYGTKSENRFYQHELHDAQMRSRSIILNPYQLPVHVPGLYDVQVTPNLNAVHVNHSYPPTMSTIMVHNVNNQPNNSHISPPNALMSSLPNSNITSPKSPISPNNDARSAMSSHCEEGTSPTIPRKLSDFPALPQQQPIGPYDTSVSSKLPHKHHRHRTSLHMTPAGYMDDKYVSAAVRNKKADHSNANSMINTPNIEMRSTLSGIAEQTIEILKLGELEYDSKDIDVDDIDIALATEILAPQNSNETDTDLSKELFPSPSHSSIKNAKNNHIKVEHKVILDPFFYLQSVGSLPVIISPNNKYKANITEQMRPNSVVLAANIEQDRESSPEPLQLPLLLNNNSISPLKEDSESTYNDALDADVCSKSNELSYYSTYSSSHSDDDEYASASNTGNTMRTRITRSCINYIVSDVDCDEEEEHEEEEHEDEDDDEEQDIYVEIIKPMSENAMKTEREFVYASSMALSVNERSETSTSAKDDDEVDDEVDDEIDEEIDDEIILQHANKLMSLLEEDDANKLMSDNEVIEEHHHHKNCSNSISLQV